MGTALAFGQDATFYLSPTGSDKNPGTAARPFGSLDQAREAIRKAGASAHGDVTVAILPGEYFLDHAVNFTERDSGMNGHRAIYRVQGTPGSARFIGGAKITQWTPVSEGLYKSHLGKGYVFSTLYEDGIRADMARSPNRQSKLGVSRGPYLTIVKAGGSPEGDFIEYDPAQFNPKGMDLTFAQIYCWQDGNYHAWISTTGPVKGVDAANHRIYTMGGRLATGAPNRFLIQNSLDLLDAPGEFFFSPKSGDLFYRPRHGTPEGHEILAPRVRELIHIEGASEDKPVHDIVFDGLDLEATDAVFPHHADWDEKADGQNLGALTITKATGIAIRNARFTDIGMSAISLLDYAQKIVVHGCLIEHTGIHGVLLQGRLNSGDVNRDNEISSCRIHFVGELAGYAAGIHVLNSGHNLITHDELSESPRYGLAFRTTTQHNVPDPSYVSGNMFRYLSIFNTGQDSGDSGAIYNVNFQNGFNTVEQSAIFHNYADPSMLDKKPNGVYDDRDSGNTIYRNVMSWDNEWFPYRQDPDPRPAKFENVNWVRGFDIGKMEWNKIGLDGGFPLAYRLRGDVNVDEADSRIRYNGNWLTAGQIPEKNLTATASTEDSAYPASMAVDGDPMTKWQSASRPLKAPLPQSITIDLHGSYKVAKVSYLPWQDGLYVTPREIWEGDTTGRYLGYKVYTSVNGKDFILAGSGTWPNTRAEKVAVFMPVAASYVRLEANSGGKDMASAGEINIFDERANGIPSIGSATAGDSASFTFFGPAIRWIGSKAPGCGKADVYLDDVLARPNVDCSATQPKAHETLFARAGLSTESSHTIKIVVKSGIIPVEAFVYNENPVK